MKRGLVFTGLVRCDQPGCGYEMPFERAYTGHCLDQLCVRIDALDYHRSEQHPDVYASEEEGEGG